MLTLRFLSSVIMTLSLLPSCLDTPAVEFEFETTDGRKVPCDESLHVARYEWEPSWQAFSGGLPMPCAAGDSEQIVEKTCYVPQHQVIGYECIKREYFLGPCLESRPVGRTWKAIGPKTCVQPNTDGSPKKVKVIVHSGYAVPPQSW